MIDRRRASARESLPAAKSERASLTGSGESVAIACAETMRRESRARASTQGIQVLQAVLLLTRETPLLVKVSDDAGCLGGIALLGRIGLGDLQSIVTACRPVTTRDDFPGSSEGQEFEWSGVGREKAATFWLNPHNLTSGSTDLGRSR